MSDPSPLDPDNPLTGFFGSGKTTRTRSRLKQPVWRRLAVIINEFGADRPRPPPHRAVQQGYRVLDSGCLCSTVLSDIVETLTNLFIDRVNGKIPYLRVAIRPTRLADPAPILHTLMTDSIVGHATCSMGLSLRSMRSIEPLSLIAEPEAIKQAAVADICCWTKADLAEPVPDKSSRPGLTKNSIRAPRLWRHHKAPSIRRCYSTSAYMSAATKSVDVRRRLRDEAFRAATRTITIR